MTEYQTRSDFQVIRVFGCWILAGSWSGSNVKSEVNKSEERNNKIVCLAESGIGQHTHAMGQTHYQLPPNDLLDVTKMDMCS